MAKIGLVLHYDILDRITRPGFWLGGVLVPLLALAILIGVGYIQEQAGTLPTTPAEPAATARPIGYVDEAQLIRTALPDATLRAYPNQAAARAALEQGAISLYYVIPADYLQTGKLLAYTWEFNPLDTDRSIFDPRLEALIKLNLLQGDAERLERLSQPMRLSVEAATPQPDYDESNPLVFYIPYSVLLLFYGFIMMSASLLLNAINLEKRNRVLEVLLVSLHPRELLAGKMLSLGLLSLFQLLIWVGSGLLMLRLGGKTLSIPPGLVLPASLLLWGILFFLLGYALYASLMAGIGALVTDLREASQVTLLVISPLIVPLFFVSLLIEEPHGLFSTILSLVPFTAPVVMMMRLAIGQVPLWQPLVALAGLALVAPLVLRATANLFRAQTMLTGQPLTIKRYLLALVGKL